MKTPEQDRLLNDVLRNEGYVAFRAELHQKSLAEFRRQRWVKTQNQLLALAACVILVMGLSLLLTSRPATRTKAEPVFATIRSKPLSKDRVITTTARLTATPVATIPQVSPLTFQAARIEVVRTGDHLESIATISDDQLLDLFHGHPLALVTRGFGTKTLVFLDIDDQAQFFGPAQSP